MLVLSVVLAGTGVGVVGGDVVAAVGATAVVSVVLLWVIFVVAVAALAWSDTNDLYEFFSFGLVLVLMLNLLGMFLSVELFLLGVSSVFAVASLYCLVSALASVSTGVLVVLCRLLPLLLSSSLSSLSCRQLTSLNDSR